jgi:disulfide bond formation protein DsbB
MMRLWPIAALIASALMLAAAHAFERFGDLDPCALCLRQREVYWAAIGIAAAAIALPFVWANDTMRRVLGFGLGLAFLTGAAVAVYHAGAEWKFWPGPPTCLSSGLDGLSGGDILSALDKKGPTPSCEEAAWRMFGISMAGYNVLISLVLAAISFYAATVRARPEGDI